VIWLFTAVLWAGLLTMRVEARWALTAFEVALFTLAAAAIAQRRFALTIHPIAAILAAIALWGLAQVALNISVDSQKTLEASLHWAANCAAFSLALHLARRRFLTAQAIFGLLVAIAAVIALLTTGSLGAFAYRNQFAAFVEVCLALAVVAALRQRLWILVAAALFASVIAAGSRAGSALCLGVLVALPFAACLRGLIPGKTLLRIAVLSAASAAALVAVVGWETIWQRFNEPHPYSVRAEMNRSSLNMIRDRPLTGFGLGAWPSAYPMFARYDDGAFVNQAHNDWAQWTAEGGLPLLAAMLAVLAILAPKAWRSIWGLGLIAVFVHAAVDYPFEQRPALAAWLFAMMGALMRASGTEPVT
jgi:O-antigen ligase